MAFPTDEIVLGPRSYGARKGHEGMVFHTTEGAGPSRANALATISMQSPGGSLYAGGGSYNFYIYDGGVILGVPYMESSGSLTTKRTNPPWDPEPWLSKMLSPAAFADPNAYLVSVAFSGKAADLAAGKYPPNMIETAARLIRWFEKSSWGADNAIVMGHADWQSNRSDPGTGVVPRILKAYEAQTAAATPTPAPTDYKALYEAERAKVARLTTDLEAAIDTREWMRAKIRAARPHIDAAIEAKNALEAALVEANKL